ncbi:TetR/AcrR family transcriptional regulator [Tateyamaria sp.]|uniref:TetR/AcrR family transcriptional regulator n=1 Tax=Tateyamaria sp. TaxID=1929288 RepID=UPI003B224A23
MDSTTKPTQRYHHGDLRPELVRIGRQMIEDEVSPSFRGLARAAKVSHSAPQHHFPTWGHVLAACAADGYRELSADLEQVRAASGADPRDAMFRMGDAYLDFAGRSPVIFRLMFNKSALDVRTEELDREASAAYGHLASAVRALDPAMTDVKFDMLINSLWALIHGMSVLHIEGQVCISPTTTLTTPAFLRSGLAALIAR